MIIIKKRENEKLPRNKSKKKRRRQKNVIEINKMKKKEATKFIKNTKIYLRMNKQPDWKICFIINSLLELE